MHRMSCTVSIGYVHSSDGVVPLDRVCMCSEELLQTYTEYSGWCRTLCLLYKPLPAGSVPFCLNILYCTARTEAALIFGQLYAHNQLIKSIFSHC